jgi:hypothetical protein
MRSVSEYGRRAHAEYLSILQTGSGGALENQVVPDVFRSRLSAHSRTDTLFHRYCLQPAPSARCSVWICCHGRAVSRRPRPVIDPLPPNAGGLFEDLATRAMPVLDYNDDPGVEFSLRVINVG